MVSSIPSVTASYLYSPSISTSLGGVSSNTTSRRSADALTLGQTQSLYEKATGAGETVKGLLSEIRSQLVHAQMDGVVAGSSAGRYTRQGKIAVLLRQVEQAVATAEYKGVNLLSSTGKSARVQVTSYGGSFTVSPRPVDVRGLNLSELSIEAVDLRALGLDDLGIISDSDVDEALRRIDLAIELADERLGLIGQIDNLVNGTGYIQQINRQNVSVDARSLPSGTFIDIIA